MPAIGIDFGTTNSAVAMAGDSGVELVPLEGAPYWRTVLFFEPSGRLSAGAPAIARYLETGGEGRLIQSIKSHLASASFSKTIIFNRRWALDDMIAAYLRQLRAGAPAGIELGNRCVIGRPVRYWGAETAEDDTRALTRMREALSKAGFDDVAFEYEPVGAAFRYAARLDHEELIVVADFGGGTTDFSVMSVPPGGDGMKILATGGIGISGDAFDARVIDAVVSPALGKGTSYRVDGFGGIAPIPTWLYSHLRRWHYLSFLKEESTIKLLERVTRGALEPAKFEGLVRIVEEDLGLPLHRAVEGAKSRLSASDHDRVTVRDIDLDLPVTRAGFDSWISEDLDDIDRVLGRVLDEANVKPADVDRVFATGGSSLVPVVRSRLAARFGADKVVGGEELTSVAWGLAARARQLFG
ncbi:MAG: Hsp70 family protein [Deltaproteobacteria bacterium]|nr:Hsp70 family protein [Deltaproteobacteria bacterium]